MVEVADLCAWMTRMEAMLWKMNLVLDRFNGVSSAPSSSSTAAVSSSNLFPPVATTVAAVSTTKASINTITVSATTACLADGGRAIGDASSSSGIAIDNMLVDASHATDAATPLPLPLSPADADGVPTAGAGVGESAGPVAMALLPARTSTTLTASSRPPTAPTAASTSTVWAFSSPNPVSVFLTAATPTAAPDESSNMVTLARCSTLGLTQDAHNTSPTHASSTTPFVAPTANISLPGVTTMHSRPSTSSTSMEFRLINRGSSVELLSGTIISLPVPSTCSTESSCRIASAAASICLTAVKKITKKVPATHKLFQARCKNMLALARIVSLGVRRAGPWPPQCYSGARSICVIQKPPWMPCQEVTRSWTGQSQLIDGFLLETSP